MVAGIAIEEGNVKRLAELGVKDSKLLTPRKRSLLFRQIKKLTAGVCVERIEPRFIDEVVRKGERLYRLNYLEARHMAKALARLDFEMAYVDCCDTNQARFGDLVADLLLEERIRIDDRKIKGTRMGLHAELGKENPLRQKIKSEHHADRNYLVVSAASVIAKVTRDAAIKRLYAEHGEFGSGYPSDPQTVQFLKRFIDSSTDLPSFTRLSWATIERVIAEGKARVIEDFVRDEAV